MIFKKVNFDYDYSVFLNADYTQHWGSCLSYQKVEQADLHEKFAGKFPDTYHEDNTRLRQLWWTSDDVDYNLIGEQFGIEVKTVSSILQPPGNTVTLHRDMFFKFKKDYPTEAKPMVRANIYLEDWQIGHVLQYQHKDKWINDSHCKQGQGYLWDSDILHLSCNAGLTDKYTLQISGFLLDNDLDRIIEH